MLMRTDQVARFLSNALKRPIPVRHVYYLLDMGFLEGTHAGVEWRIFPFSVREYVESESNRDAGGPTDHFDYEGRRGLLFSSRYDGLPLDLPPAALSLQRRSRRVEHPSGGPDQVRQETVKPMIQFEFDLSA